jgi:hypothetical protein
MARVARARNQPCICGSGQKSKDCCRNKQPREQHFFLESESIGAIFPDGVIPASTWEFEWSDKGLTVRIGSKVLPMSSPFLVNSYARPGKKDKVLRQIPIETLAPRDLLNLRGVHKSYFSFDLIFVVDTNTKLVGSTQHSASYALICKATVRAAKGKFHYRPYAAFEYRDLSPTDAEKRGIVDLIRSIEHNRGYRAGLRIGIVTDHDLASHVGINSRRIPLWGGSQLPENFKILYASADGGLENPLNKAMALCDKMASAILDGRSRESSSK